MPEELVTIHSLDLFIYRSVLHRDVLMKLLKRKLLDQTLTGVGLWRNIETSIAKWVFEYPEPEVKKQANRLLYLDSMRWIHNLSKDNKGNINKEVLKEALRERRRYLRIKLSINNE